MPDVPDARDELHALLLRQLRRAGLDPETPPDAAAWPELLASLSRAYTTMDQDRYLLERALETSGKEMEVANARLADERDRLQREMVIATVLQTSLLPQVHTSSSYEVAATLVPATEVGGDYYDVIHDGEMCWLAIGDVAGHGLRTALIAMMAQSIVAATVRRFPPPAPSEVLAIANRALWENVRKRLGTDEHMTCTLLRCAPDGRITFAGAHEDIIVSRAGGGCVTIHTQGTWLGAIPEVSGKNEDHELTLQAGDIIVMFTDGITEARNADRVQFGLDRLLGLIEAHRHEPLRVIRDAVFDAVRAFCPRLDDDATVVVVGYRTAIA